MEILAAVGAKQCTFPAGEELWIDRTFTSALAHALSAAIDGLEGSRGSTGLKELCGRIRVEIPLRRDPQYKLKRGALPIRLLLGPTPPAIAPKASTPGYGYGGQSSSSSSLSAPMRISKTNYRAMSIHKAASCFPFLRIFSKYNLLARTTVN